MTRLEQNKRLKAVKVADSINAIEGVPVSNNAKLLSQRWVKGEITGAEMKAMLLKAHKQPKTEELR